jgi:hypothetical protein
VNLNLAVLLCLELHDLPGNVALEQDRVVPVDLIKGLDATNFGRVLRAVAFSSAGSVDLGQEGAKIS